MCPNVWTEAPNRRTNSVTLTCIDATLLVNTRPPAGTTPRITTSLDIKPDGGTLFHEIIHLIQGVTESMPGKGEVYLPSVMLGKVNRKDDTPFTSDEAFVNPQTYMYAA